MATAACFHLLEAGMRLLDLQKSPCILLRAGDAVQRVEFSRNRGPKWNDGGRGPPARR